MSRSRPASGGGSFLCSREDRSVTPGEGKAQGPGWALRCRCAGRGCRHNPDAEPGLETPEPTGPEGLNGRRRQTFSVHASQQHSGRGAKTTGRGARVSPGQAAGPLPVRSPPQPQGPLRCLCHSQEPGGPGSAHAATTAQGLESFILPLSEQLESRAIKEASRRSPHPHRPRLGFQPQMPGPRH